MKIVYDDDIKKFTVNNKYVIQVNYEQNNSINSIELWNNEDPVHTGDYFESMQDFIHYINGLTDVAKKIKEENNL